jgi:hypothetical protein
MSEYVKLSKDTEQVVKDKNLIRRRFYLTKESLLFLDSLSVQQNQSPSVLLDSILLLLSKKQSK